LIKILIVDDSAFMRVKIRSIIESQPNMRVIGVARNGFEAVEKVQTLQPDVVTMDILMPQMSGIEAVEMIMKVRPTPILVISALTREGINDTIKALEKGAVDYIQKDQLQKDILIEKINAVVKGGILPPKQPEKSKPKNRVSPSEVLTKNNISIVCIGISTGGPKALADVIPNIQPAISAPIVIAQHMPPVFTKFLAERLSAISKIPVMELENNQQLLPGHAYICPGGMNVAIENIGTASLYPKEKFNYTYSPSVDLLMQTAGQTYGANTLCIIMTGMGSDGLDGIMEAKKHGSYVIAQSESTCTIYGMPKVIIDNKLHDEIVDLEDIADRINALCSA